MPNWIKNLSPDITETFSRFPLAIVLSFFSTLTTIGLTNDVFPHGTEFWIRLSLGMSIGAVFAIAGVLFAESKKQTGWKTVVAAYGIPLAAIALMQIDSTQWIVAPMLAPLSLLWLSVASFTNIGEGAERKTIQNEFWWLNHRAITTAVIAGFGFALIALGLVAIERAMAILFAIKSSRLFYEILLPFTGLFLTPVYWLSTIPKLSDYTESDISEPDFLSRAIGFLGQFILTPFLFLYALILLAYAAQILFTQSLPQGTLSWMVLGFTIVGAANWLVLYPDFMHARPLVRYFRKFWFWLTLIPAALYIIGVWVRVDAYGLTQARVGLIAAGIWFVLLSLAFLTKRLADIRLIPTLALIVLTVFSVGPLNYINLPQLNQANRLAAAISSARSNSQDADSSYEWTEQTARIARSAINYLFNTDRNREILKNTLVRQGVDPNDNFIRVSDVYQVLQLSTIDEPVETANWALIRASKIAPTDLSSTPIFLGWTNVILNSQGNDIAHLSIKLLEESLLTVEGPSHVVEKFSLEQWLADQSRTEILNPVFDFTYQGDRYKLLVHSFNLGPNSNNRSITQIRRIDAILFSATTPSDNLPPVNLTSQ